MEQGYAHGRRDGLRLALSILAAEEEKWAALLGESRSWRTNVTRQVRHKTLQVAQQRLRTALNRLTPKSDQTIDPEVALHWKKSGSDPVMTHHKLKLPSKICLGCGRPFIWRKKWARDWEEVKFCSERCRRHGGAGKSGGNRLKAGAHPDMSP